MGWGKETWAWWPPSVTMIKCQDGGFWCTLCPTSWQLTGAKCGCSEEVHQHSLYALRVLSSPLSRHEHTLWGHFLHPIPLDWLHLCRLLPFSDTEVVLPHEMRERWGWKCFPISERLYGKAQKRSTASPIQFHCWSLCQPLIPIKKRAPRWREDWAFT